MKRTHKKDCTTCRYNCGLKNGEYPKDCTGWVAGVPFYQAEACRLRAWLRSWLYFAGLHVDKRTRKTWHDPNPLVASVYVPQIRAALRGAEPPKNCRAPRRKSR